MKSTQPILGYHHLSRAWYAEPNIRLSKKHDSSYVDEITFGRYYPDGGCEGEMTMKWFVLGKGVAPRLEVFSDAWGLLADLPVLLSALKSAENTDPSPAEFCAMLDKCGFKNLTVTKSPYTS
jgi:hypothetical protein